VRPGFAGVRKLKLDSVAGRKLGHIGFTHMKTTKQSAGTRSRLLRKIARAYHNVDSQCNPRRRSYWIRQANKLTIRLYGRPDVWVLHDEWTTKPTSDMLKTIDGLMQSAHDAMGFPAPHCTTGIPHNLVHCDLAAGPDIAKEVLMTRVRGKFCIAEELTKNPPY